MLTVDMLTMTAQKYLLSIFSFVALRAAPTLCEPGVNSQWSCQGCKGTCHKTRSQWYTMRCTMPRLGTSSSSQPSHVQRDLLKQPRPLTQHSDPCTAHTSTVGALSSQHEHSVATVGHTQQLQPTMPSVVASGSTEERYTCQPTSSTQECTGPAIYRCTNAGKSYATVPPH
jgi:hypothetical protein